MKYYDSSNNRLVFIEQQATEDYWDEHWNEYEVEKVIKSASSSRFILGHTRAYLRPGARILEGGCGLGQYVYCLHINGYDSYGIDYATKTVRQVKQVMPELKVFGGDVRELPFGDEFFDGYWSLGVIEHFYDGFESVALEMKRVLKPGGYLFLTFPYLSYLRRLKISKGKYELWQPNQERIADFYQFALSGKHVREVFSGLGFELVSSKGITGLKGFKDELGPRRLRRLLQSIYDTTSLPGQVFAYGLDLFLSPLTGHCEMMILRRLG